MKIISLVVHAYILVLIYEILSEDKRKYINGVAVLLIAGVKYLMERRSVTSNLVPIVICTILIIYSVYCHSRNSNIANLKFAIVAYGVNYAISIVLGSVCGFMAAVVHLKNASMKYLVLDLGRIMAQSQILCDFGFLTYSA